MFLSAKRKKAGTIFNPVFLLFAAIGLIFTFSAAVRAERLPVKSYTVTDGLLQDNVYKIRQDSRGFLWFCSEEGLTRFDGVAMISFTVADGLPGSRVEDFFETRAGTIYIATNRGLARLNPHGLRDSPDNPLFTVFMPDEPKARTIDTLYEDKNNRIWVGTSDGLYTLHETGRQASFEKFPLGGPIAEPGLSDLYVNTILEDRHGALWVGTLGRGLFRISKNGGVTRFMPGDGLGDNKITDLLEDRAGRLWVSKRSDDTGGVCILETEGDEAAIKKCYAASDGLGSNWIRDILETSDGQIWLATVPGLCRWQEADGVSGCKTYTARNDLCDGVRTLVEDKGGNLWTGSACGVKKIVRYGFTTFDEADGLNSNWVNSIFENPAGDLFVTTYPQSERLIGRFENGRFSLVKPKLPGFVNYHGWGSQQTVWQDSAGAWWIPSGFGLFRSPENTPFEALAGTSLEVVETGATWENLGPVDPKTVADPAMIPPPGVKAYEVFRLFEDSRGDVWMLTTSTANELFRWERAQNKWHNYTAQGGFSELRVGMGFVEDRSGNVWIAASSDHQDSALIRVRNGEFRVLTQAEGAPSGWLRDLFIDSRGRLWIASDKDGVWRLDDPNGDVFEFVKYTPANGLTSLATASLTEDEYGRIYIGTWRGIDRLNPDTGQVETFTTDDGLPASLVDVAYRDRKNNLWFGTLQGVARFVPEQPRTRRPPAVLITGLRIGGEPQRVSILGETEIPPLDLSPDQRQIAVDFLGLGATLGEKLRYEYRFGGADWTPTTERTVNFANLASGDYRFEIRAVSAGRVTSQPAFASFRIAAPIWQRWWFIGLMTGLVTLAIYLIYRNRLARLLEMERTRTRIATDLHDDIGTNLSKISLLSGIVSLQLQTENAQNRQMLNSIAEISRESVNSMSDIVWAINPQRDSVLEMSRRMREFAEEIFIEKDVRVRFNAPDERNHLKLAMDTRRELYLIFKESVTNAAKYSGCTEIEIEFRVDGTEIFLEIKDNGGGFDATRKTDGNGLENIKNRARKLGGTLEILTGINRGAKISVRAPCEHTQVKTTLKKAKVSK